MKLKKILAILLAAVTCLAVSACSQSPAATTTTDKSINLSMLMDEMLKLSPEGIALSEMQMTDLTALYNISSTEISSFSARMVNVGILADELVLVKVRDGMVDQVKAKFDARYNAKLAEMNNYLPDEYTKIQNCPVLVNGNYIALLVSANGADMAKLFGQQFEN